MGTGVLSAVGVQTQGVVGDHKAFGLRHRLLALLDLGIVKLLHPTTVQTYQMVMVLAPK